ncbi:MAG: Sb-PDE family phosphodiesterase [Draconibacterium sp.]|nr:Sb-PDE family phosphodiesterase [Draconibacterium sp.]
MKNVVLAVLFVFVSLVSVSQTITETRENSPKFEIPDIPGYFTMKCDFHMHTVFSDGKVWPDVRVNEALAEGLDAISITDHVEKKRTGVDDNHVMGYEIARLEARGKDLVVVSGGEISASKDHYNALFLTNQDDTVLRDKTPAVRIKGANDQGGFVFWNHPGWTSKYKDGNTPQTEEFVSLLKNGQVKGIEICNGDGYWESAHKMALENNLTIIGNSDIHGLSYYPYTDKHRTITLVFATEKSVEGIQDALLNQRTAIFRGYDLIGSETFLKPLFLESVEVKADYRKETSIAQVQLINNSDFNFVCDYTGDYGLYNSLGFVTIPAHATTVIGVKTNEILESFDMDFTVHNAITSPGKKLQIEIPVKVETTE